MFVIQNNTELQRYEVFEAGERIGWVQYEMHDGQMWVLGTHMKRKFRGVARAHRIMGFVVEDARRRRIRILPFCPALRVFMSQNPATCALVPGEWLDRVAKTGSGEQEPADRAVLKYIRFTGSPWRKSVARQPVTTPSGAVAA